MSNRYIVHLKQILNLKEYFLSSCLIFLCTEAQNSISHYYPLAIHLIVLFYIITLMFILFYQLGFIYFALFLLMFTKNFIRKGRQLL